MAIRSVQTQQVSPAGDRIERYASPVPPDVRSALEPLLAILFSFIYSFSSYRLKEEQGRFLKLFAGAFMVFFGLIMIAKPELLVLG